MRRRLTEQEVNSLQELEGLIINGKFPIYITDNTVDLIEGLEVSADKEVMRYLLIAPNEYMPPIRDKKVLIEELLISGEELVLDKLSILYEVVTDKITREKYYNIIISTLSQDKIEDLKGAGDLIQVDRDLKTIINLEESIKEDLIFNMNPSDAVKVNETGNEDSEFEDTGWEEDDYYNEEPDVQDCDEYDGSQDIADDEKSDKIDSEVEEHEK